VIANVQDDPSTIAARNLDWEVFYKNQNARGRRLLAMVAEGSFLREVAQLLDLSDSGGKAEHGIGV
jgi:hypothetical protein